MWKSDNAQLSVKVKHIFIFFVALKYFPVFIFYLAEGKTFQPTLIEI